MSEKTLKFDNITLDEKTFHKLKEPIGLLSIDLDRIVVSYKFKDNGEKFKYFIGYQKNEIIKSLCIILPQMSGYIKYFEKDGKNMSFLIKDDKLWDKYNEIWDVIKDKLGIKFHSEPAHEYKYLKAKVRKFDGVIKTNFLGNGMPKENMYYTCIACITIDSVMNIDKKNHPQVYLEECKYRIKKTKVPKFIKTELKSDSDSDLNSDDEELMAKLEKFDIDSDFNSEKN